MSPYGVVREAVRRPAVIAGLKPPPELTLSEWADEHFRLSAESSATSGRWSTLPYQKEILDAMTDPRVTYVTLMKSARVGYTLMATAAVGYYIHQAPCSILIVQPTVEDAKSFSKETIAPMLRDVPVLSEIVHDDTDDDGPKDSGTILHKKYPGGVLSMVGANSGSGLRRISRRVVILDEIDAYPASAGADGDPVKLAEKRADYFWNRKIFVGSTPLVAGHSRIEERFEAGDQRRFYVPCPHCGHRDFFVFTEREGGGHFMQWPKDKPEEAYFVCSKNGCVIEHKNKREMVALGEWRAAQPFKGHASFHIWAAYSYSPNATWGQIAAEFLEAKRGGPETLRVYVNTVLGEVWHLRGDAPDWERLYQRREHYSIGSVPAGVKFLTAGVDVQKDRFVFEVVGWSASKESWTIDAGVIPGDTSNESSWLALDGLLARQYESAAGPMSILMLAVDSGYNTQQVYNWVRRHAPNRVIAVKGMTTARALVGAPTPVDVLHNGKRYRGGGKVWPVGVDVAKAELYGWLRLNPPTTESGLPHPPGFCHFPELGEDYFKQLTGEHLVSSVKRNGFTQHEWQLIPGRENHYLDCRVYARAAAAVAGLDRMTPKETPAKPSVSTPRATVAPKAQTTRKQQIPDSSRFDFNRGKGWFR